jgi:IclR family acetate operon transcriptional repressor
MSNDLDARGGSVQSLRRAFTLLELIADAGGELTLSELAVASALPQPTIHRLLRTLVSAGYVNQHTNRKYLLGPRLIRLGDVAQRQLGTIGRPQLRGLVEALGETANLAVLHDDMVMYVAQVPSPHAMRMFTEVGRRVHLHDSGVGKAILAGLDDDEVRSIVARAGQPTPTERSIGTIDGLLAELEVTRGRGYAIDDGEQEEGVRCYAVPVPAAPIPAAISVSGPAFRVSPDFGRRAVPLLHDAAERMAVAFSAGPGGGPGSDS